MSPYASETALRAALEQRLLNLARATGVNLDRLRRQVVLERLLARLVTAEPGVWVLKGAMALEVRLGTAARATMDIDLGMRDPAPELALTNLADRLIAATDPRWHVDSTPHVDHDHLVLAIEGRLIDAIVPACRSFPPGSGPPGR